MGSKPILFSYNLHCYCNTSATLQYFSGCKSKDWPGEDSDAGYCRKPKKAKKNFALQILVLKTKPKTKQKPVNKHFNYNSNDINNAFAVG